VDLGLLERNKQLHSNHNRDLKGLRSFAFQKAGGDARLNGYRFQRKAGTRDGSSRQKVYYQS